MDGLQISPSSLRKIQLTMENIRMRPTCPPLPFWILKKNPKHNHLSFAQKFFLILHVYTVLFFLFCFFILLGSTQIFTNPTWPEHLNPCPLGTSCSWAFDHITWSSSTNQFTQLTRKCRCSNFARFWPQGLVHVDLLSLITHSWPFKQQLTKISQST